MATQKQIIAFDQALGNILEETIGFEDDVARQVVRELRGIRARISDAILNADGFEMLHFQRIQRNVESIFQQWGQQLNGVLDEELRKAFNLGQQLIDEPFIAAGGGIEVSALPQISAQAIGAATQRNTTFITNLSKTAAGRINNAIMVGISGELSPHQVMRQIGTVLTDGSVFRSIAVRAEMIARTEVSTALNKATMLRAEQANRQIGGLRKFWIHTTDKRTRPEHIAVGRATNPALGGKPIPVKQKFKVAGKKGMQPQDAALGASQVIGCRCRMGFTMLKSSQVEDLTNIVGG